jgi:hypothetical protein
MIAKIKNFANKYAMKASLTALALSVFVGVASAKAASTTAEIMDGLGQPVTDSFVSGASYWFSNYWPILLGIVAIIALAGYLLGKARGGFR